MFISQSESVSAAPAQLPSPPVVKKSTAYRTMEFLALNPDPQVILHTLFASWFLNSLYLITLTAAGYALFTLFRPVLYRLRTFPQDHARAAVLVNQYGCTALDYFKYWPDKTIFFSSTETVLSLSCWRQCGDGLG